MSVFLHRAGLLKPAAAGGITLSVFDSAINAGEEITVPAGVQSGDLFVLLDTATAGSTPSTQIPSGFTSVDNRSGTNIRQIVSYKIADGTETILSGMAQAGGDEAKELYVFRGDTAISTVTISSPVNGEQTNGTPSAQSVTASGGTAPLIVIGCYGGRESNVISPRTFTPAKDGEITAADNSYLAYKIYNSAPADVSISMEDEGLANILQSFYIECS